MPEPITTLWRQAVALISLYSAEIMALLALLVVLVTMAHILLNKRDARAAAAWTGLVWLVPFFGALIYMVLGVNRIRRRARQLTQGGLETIPGWFEHHEPSDAVYHLHTLSVLVGRVTRLPLTTGNRVELMEAPQAFDAMLDAVESATESIYLSTYIFGNDAAGHRMVEALGRAVDRGLQVKVLVDGMGSLYSFPPVIRRLRRAGVETQRFLYSLRPWRMPYINLRNHRKLLIVDRREGFTGGMNIREGYLQSPPAIRDLHARLAGPVVGQLLSSFVIDWNFTCGEWLPTGYAGEHEGEVEARAIVSGPDTDFDKRRLTLLGALGRAEQEIRIITPYFVPDATLIAAIQLAAMRGVSVQLILPARNNLKVVDWASRHVLPWLAEQGVDIRFTPGCFDHSKLMTVDGCWGLFGSGNWDARSLRLNFEFDVECYDPELAERFNMLIDRRSRSAISWSDSRMASQSRWARLRNAAAHLLEPYL
jgi:cardiolipin synthase